MQRIVVVGTMSVDETIKGKRLRDYVIRNTGTLSDIQIYGDAAIIAPEHTNVVPDKIPAAIISVIRIRQEKLTRPPETFQNDFVMELPKDCNLHHLADYAQQKLRDMAYDLLTSKDGGLAIRASCSDFNWGDFIMELPRELAQRHGMQLLCLDDEALLPYQIVGHETVTLQQDEILLRENNKVMLHVTFDDGSDPISGPANCDMTDGQVEPEFQFPTTHIKTITMRFLNQPEDQTIPVSKGEPETNDLYFWVDCYDEEL